ncbi:hypothetical protein Pfo_009493, partial [Paulownia fortunei]
MFKLPDCCTVALLSHSINQEIQINFPRSLNYPQKEIQLPEGNAFSSAVYHQHFPASLPVPDNQVSQFLKIFISFEAFVDQTRDVSLILELLDLKTRGGSGECHETSNEQDAEGVLSVVAVCIFEAD